MGNLGLCGQRSSERCFYLLKLCTQEEAQLDDSERLARMFVEFGSQAAPLLHTLYLLLLLPSLPRPPLPFHAHTSLLTTTTHHHPPPLPRHHTLPFPPPLTIASLTTPHTDTPRHTTPYHTTPRDHRQLRGDSRNHVEEGCERELNKRKDGTFHRENTTTCTTHHYTPTSTARVGALIWSHPADWITPVRPGITPKVDWGRYDGRPWLNVTSSRMRHRSQTRVANTGGAHTSLVAE